MEVHSPAGRLVVGCFTTLAPFLLPRLLEGLQAAFPEVILDFVEGSLVELQRLLLEGRCELALLYGVDLKPAIHQDVLYLTRPHVLLPSGHLLADAETVRLADLAGHDMVVLDVPPRLQYFTEVLAGAGVTPSVRPAPHRELRDGPQPGRPGCRLLAADPTPHRRRQLRGSPAGGPPHPRRGRPVGAEPTRRAAAFAAFCHATVSGISTREGGVAKLPAPVLTTGSC